MAPRISENISAIRSLCKQHHITKLYHFGSVARNELKRGSDVDFLYAMDTSSIDFNDNDNAPFDMFDNFFSLKESIEELLRRKIDLVPKKELRNPCLPESIAKDIELLYTA